MSEIKNFDREWQISAGTPVWLNFINENIVQGFASNQRIGLVINMTYLDIKGWVARDYVNKTEKLPTLARMVIVYDNQSNASDPNITQVLTPGSVSGAPDHAMNDMPNRANEDRFTILYDKRWKWDYFDMSAINDESNGDNESIKLIDERIPIHRTTSYTRLSAKPTTGGLIAFFWSTDDGVTDSIFNRCFFRLYYQDY